MESFKREQDHSSCMSVWCKNTIRGRVYLSGYANKNNRARIITEIFALFSLLPVQSLVLHVFLATALQVGDVVEAEPQEQVGDFHNCTDEESSKRHCILLASGERYPREVSHNDMGDEELKNTLSKQSTNVEIKVLDQ